MGPIMQEPPRDANSSAFGAVFFNVAPPFVICFFSSSSRVPFVPFPGTGHVISWSSAVFVTIDLLLLPERALALDAPSPDVSLEKADFGVVLSIQSGRSS